MKVLKFGETSVATAESRQIVREIIARESDGNAMIVVVATTDETNGKSLIEEIQPQAVGCDATDFMRTEEKDGKQALDIELTYQLMQEKWSDTYDLISTSSPLFIASSGNALDRDSGLPTDLGRGGTDYTAAIVAAALYASELQIWTDVDGFMTADPRVINNAYTIGELTYLEAMELSHFGAKVIYPPTIYPAFVKSIPIHIRNTFNAQAAGTVVKAQTCNDGKPIKGISSISHTSTINVTGLSMVGVIGVNQRIFTALANHRISVFMVAQASSESSTTIAVREQDAPTAARVLNDEFRNEIKAGSMFPMQVQNDLATIAIVGENMKHTPGISGKLFSTLGRSGISVSAYTQGAQETNISFIVRQSHLRKALSLLHDAFFLSEYKELNLFICGIGTVGSRLIDQIRTQQPLLQEQNRLKLNVVGIANSTRVIFNPDGIPLQNYKKLLDESTHPSTPAELCDAIDNMNLFNSVFVDCTASADISDLYSQLLQRNVNIFTANKIAASSPYKNYTHLKHTALHRGVKFLFETNVGAGLPIIGTINDLRNSGDRILRIEAILSGTLNYIFNALSATTPFSEAVRQAKEQGYSEPDPRIDLSGMDVVRKIVILTREAGYPVEPDDVALSPILPDNLFFGSLDNFWERLPQLDADFEQRRRALEAQGQSLRFVATMEEGRARVELRTIGHSHPFHNLQGSNNIVMLTTERYHDHPMLIQGYGAGADVTAAGVFANIISIANI
ncbi:MAG: bifunctional aspartate kinase/homoserine dehydrogenase I [Prevotella sp.]|nr:bifunctional aspartate kinase/homoserine dehydrogenase I [Prevotella sp.]